MSHKTHDLLYTQEEGIKIENESIYIEKWKEINPIAYNILKLLNGKDLDIASSILDEVKKALTRFSVVQVHFQDKNHL